jgi:hypothetical protein
MDTRALASSPGKPGHSSQDVVNSSPLRVVLDTTAIAAYARGTVDVGEVIAEVAMEGATFGLPVACLAEAVSEKGVDVGRLAVLARHASSAIVPLEASIWQPLAATMNVLGPLARASAFLAANHHDAWILTAEPSAYRGLGDDPPVIPI